LAAPGELTTRFPTIAAAVITLQVRSCVFDGELIADGDQGSPTSECSCTVGELVASSCWRAARAT
jgi:hypothetical protein